MEVCPLYEYMSCILSSILVIDSIGKDYFRLGNEVDFRGNKSLYVEALKCASVLPSSNPLSVRGVTGVALSLSLSRSSRHRTVQPLR